MTTPRDREREPFHPRRPITRRTVLRGVGVALALPWLEAMTSARAVAAAAATRPAPRLDGPDAPEHPLRMAFLYMPNGVNPHAWTPEGRGADFRLSPILQPLEALKSEILVLTNLFNEATNTGDGHYVKEAAWLCGTTITRTTGADLCSGGVSIDQYAARRVGNLTALPSLELGTEPTSTGIDPVVGYTRVYGAHISWSTPTTPVAKEIHPGLAFDRLFRSGAADRPADLDDDRSVLDYVRDDSKALERALGAADRAKLGEYLESVRAVERRVAHETKRRIEERDGDPEARAEIEALGGRVDAFRKDPGRVRERRSDHTEHCRLMLDIIALAFQTDSTRVATFMFGNAVSGKNFSFLDGVEGGHHQLSHHENDPAKLEQYARIGAWHVGQYAYLLEKLRAMPEGDGNVLDNSMIMFGSALRDGNSHNPRNLPIVLGGRGGGAFSTGRHLIYPKDTPLCNLYVSMLNAMRVPVRSFADSEGTLAALDDPNAEPPASRG